MKFYKITLKRRAMLHSYLIIDHNDLSLLRGGQFGLASPFGLKKISLNLILSKSQSKLDLFVSKSLFILKQIVTGQLPYFNSMARTGKYSPHLSTFVNLTNKLQFMTFAILLSEFFKNLDNKNYLNSITLNDNQLSFSIVELINVANFLRIPVDFFNWKFPLNFILQFNNKAEAQLYFNYFNFPVF